MRIMGGPIGQCLLSSLDDMGWRIKVRVTAPQFDDILKPFRDVEHARDQMLVFQIDALGQSGGWEGHEIYSGVRLKRRFQ